MKMPLSDHKWKSVAITLCLCACCAMGAQLTMAASTHSNTFERASKLAQQMPSLETNLAMTWRVHGVTRATRGRIMLAKPNLARIELQGDYPEIELVSDGHMRYLAATRTQYEAMPMDPRGEGIDSPWWGLPFRFFFTQSVNPFGARSDDAATFRELGLVVRDGEHLQGVEVRGDSHMGAYVETLLFDAAGDLTESRVQFGEDADAAIFTATITHVRHARSAAAVFEFKPAPGQIGAHDSDRLLAIGARAPELMLPDAAGRFMSLDQLRKGKRAVLVNFWYYNCAPCRLEFPAFQKLYEQYTSQGFTVIAIDKGDAPATVRQYAQRAELQFPILLGGQERKGSVFDHYQVSDLFPVSYLLDEHGVVVFRSVGEDMDGLKMALSQLGIR